MEFRKYKNEGDMNISSIKYSQTVYPFCKIGSENYIGEILVEMEPLDYIMDYIDEYKFINETYNNKAFSGEVLVNYYFNHLMNEYKPSHLKVTLKASTSGHFPIEISKVI